MKKLIAVMLSICLVLGMCAAAFAAGNNGTIQTETVDNKDMIQNLKAQAKKAPKAKKAAKTNLSLDDIIAYLSFYADDEYDIEDLYEILEDLGIEHPLHVIFALAWLFDDDEYEEGDWDDVEIDPVVLLELVDWLFGEDEEDYEIEHPWLALLLLYSLFEEDEIDAEEYEHPLALLAAVSELFEEE